MKKTIILISVVLLSLFGLQNNGLYAKRVSVNITMQNFYNELSPYGDWVYSSDYGYVWRPYFDHPSQFHPYSTGGYWENTAYGWTWVSDYPWGWAAFHYGRWYFDDFLGWMWIPGYEWAPAWVSWGHYNNYYGWVPMGPNVIIGHSWNAPASWWTFVPCKHFYGKHWRRHIHRGNVNIVNITYINNTYNYNNRNHNENWYYGPRVKDVENYSKTKVHRKEIVNSDRPHNLGANKNSVSVYRPIVDKSDMTARPTQITKREDIGSGRTSNLNKYKPNSDRVDNVKTDNQRRIDNQQDRRENINSGRNDNANSGRQIIRPENNTKQNREIITNSGNRKDNDATNRSINNQQQRTNSQREFNNKQNNSRNDNSINRPRIENSQSSSPQRISRTQPSSNSQKSDRVQQSSNAQSGSRSSSSGSGR